MAEQAWVRRLVGYIWGYDFFISYHWPTGGRYAVALAEALREHGCDCFLDRSEFAIGDEWKSEAQLALHRTQRLLVIGTREAMEHSAAVAHELHAYRARQRPVFLVSFGQRFAEEDRKRLPALQAIPEDSLDIVEATDALDQKPTEAVIAEILRSYRVLRRRKLRSRWVSVALSVLVAMLILSALQTKRARDQRDQAESERHRAERESFAQAGQVLVTKARNANDEDLLPAAVDLAARASAAMAAPPSPVTHALAAALSRAVYRVRRLQSAGPVTMQQLFVLPNRLLLSSMTAPPRVFNADTGAELFLLGEQPASVLASSTEGRLLLSLRDGNVEVWDVRTAKLVVRMPHNDAPVSDAAFSTDGRHLIVIRERQVEQIDIAKAASPTILVEDQAGIMTARVSGYVATLGSSGSLQLWQPDLPSPRVTIELGTRPDKIVLSPAARYVAVIRKDVCEVWNLGSGKQIGTFTVNTAGTKVLFSSDEQFLFSDLRGRLQVHDSGTASLVNSPDRAEVLRDIAAVPGGPLILTGEYAGSMTLRDPRDMRILLDGKYPLGHSKLSDDGRWLVATGDDFVARVWDLSTRRLVATLRGHDLLASAVISPDGSRIALASYDGTAELWAIDEGEAFHHSTHKVDDDKPIPIDRVLFVGDTYLATSGRDGTIKIWDRRAHTLVAEREAGMSLHPSIVGMSHVQRRDPIELHADAAGRHLLAFTAFGAGVDIWSVPDITQHIAISRKDVLSARFDAGGGHVITTCANGDVELWDAQTGVRLQAIKHGTFVESASLAPDGMHLATAGEGTVKVWNLSNPVAPTLVLHHGDVDDVIFSPDGRQLLTSGDGTTSLWNATGTNSDPWNQPRPISSVDAAYQLPWEERGWADTSLTTAFLPSGPRALTRAFDQRLRLWDVAGNRTLAILDMPFTETNSATFSADGNQVVTASADGAVRLWSSNGELLATYGGSGSPTTSYANVEAVALSPDAKWIVTGGDDGTARMYPTSFAGLFNAACDRARNDASGSQQHCQTQGIEGANR
jgi:WD40 repeat protein